MSDLHIAEIPERIHRAKKIITISGLPTTIANKEAKF